ncbi:MAG: DoxX family protein [Glaciecola sp.]|jgi:putative oxidoreductase|nr:DoxX family protein [Glaciecola sp.]MDG1816506.1 DoxX family protein [Glaciecola sp.]MDG2098771.1 DoxX family protein [Glaciecola sp.]
MNFIMAIRDLHNRVISWVNALQPVILLLARWYIAWVFFKAGLTKINDWESTLLLFEYEYEVPLLSYELAAYLGTFAELILPLLLVTGLFTRIGAIGIFVVNAIAVMSLPDMPPAAYNLHVIWAALIALNIFWGGGRFSVDHYFKIK